MTTLGTVTAGQARARSEEIANSGERPLYPEFSERAVLGSALLDNRLMRAPLQQIAVNDFGISAHQNLYRAMFHLFEDQIPFDPSTIAATVEATGGELARDWDYAAISGLLEGAVDERGRVEQHIRAVVSYSEFRRILSICEAVTQSFDEGVPLDEIKADFFKKTLRLVSGCDLDGNLLPDTERDRRHALLSACEIKP